MLLTHACVAIQLVGAPVVPAAVQALQQRCDGILGVGQCHVAPAAGATDSDADVNINASLAACWRAIVTRAGDDTTASVAVRGPGAPAARAARRDLRFQARDELSERWATLGLVIAALVTLEEHSAQADADAGAGAPAAGDAPAPPRPWMSRDPPVPATPTITAGPGDRPRGPPRLADARLDAVGDTGRIPGPAFGGRLALTLEVVRYVDIVAGVAYLTSASGASVPVAGGGAGGGHFHLWSMTLGLCPRSQLARRVSGHVCAGGDLTATTATGFGVAETARVTEWAGAVWTGFDVEVHLARHLALIMDVATEVALGRPVFAIRGAGDVYQRSRYSLSAGLGIAVAF